MNGVISAGKRFKTRSLFGLIDSFDLDYLSEYQFEMDVSSVTQGWLLKKVDVTKPWLHITYTNEILGKNVSLF